MSGVLQCEHVARSYQGFALKPMSFEIEKGYLTGLVGVNGAGKSTLLNILAGIDDRYQGEVIIAGKNLRTEYEEAKQKVALVSEKLSYFLWIRHLWKMENCLGFILNDGVWRSCIFGWIGWKYRKDSRFISFLKECI